MWSPEQFKEIWQKLSTTDNLYDNNVLYSRYTCQGDKIMKRDRKSGIFGNFPRFFGNFLKIWDIVGNFW